MGRPRTVRRGPRRRRAAAVSAALALLTVACTDPVLGPPDRPAGSAPPPTASAPAPGPCDPPTDTAVTGVIDAQLAAFADGAYDRALALASAGFRASIDADGFRALIETGFPLLTDSAEHVVQACELVDVGVVHAFVEVRGRDGDRQRLLYVLVTEATADGPRWAVTAAAPVDGAPPARTT